MNFVQDLLAVVGGWTCARHTQKDVLRTDALPVKALEVGAGAGVLF
jgi:hypothetical protein